MNEKQRKFMVWVVNPLFMVYTRNEEEETLEDKSNEDIGELTEFIGYTSFFMLRYMKAPYGLQNLLAWFHLLEQNFANNNMIFSQFVDLEKTPMVSNDPLTLTRINCINQNFLSSSVVEKSGLKEKYVLVNKCLNAHIVPNNYFEKKEALEASRNAQVYRAADPNAEEKLATSLIDFVMHCSLSDLAEQRNDSRVIQPESKVNLSKASLVWNIKNLTIIASLALNVGFIGYEIYNKF